MLCLRGILCGNREWLLNTLHMIYVVKSVTLIKIRKKEKKNIIMKFEAPCSLISVHIV